MMLPPNCSPRSRPLKFTANMAITRNMFSACMQRSAENKKELRGLNRKQFYEYFKGSDGPGYCAPPETVQIFLDMFDSLDRDGKNLISITDVLHFFYPLSTPKEIEQRRQMIEEFDETTQAENTMQHDKKTKKLNEFRILELVDAFKVYDRNGSGKLMPDAFATAVQDIWEYPPSTSEVQAYFANADPSNKGYITATDWVNWLQQTTYVTLEELSKGMRHRYELLQDPDAPLPNEPHHSSATPSPGRSQSAPGRPRQLSPLIAPLAPPPPSSRCPSACAPSPDAASHQQPAHLGHSHPVAACRSGSAADSRRGGARYEPARGIPRAHSAWSTMTSWRSSPNVAAGGADRGTSDALTRSSTVKPAVTPASARRPWHSGRLRVTASTAAGMLLQLGPPPRQRARGQSAAALAQMSPRDRGEVAGSGRFQVTSKFLPVGPPFHPDFLSLGIVRRCADLAILARAAPSRRAYSAPAAPAALTLASAEGDCGRLDVVHRPGSGSDSWLRSRYLRPPTR